MKIVLDTNVFCADFRMDGNSFRIFLGGIPRIGGTVYVPAVVRDEVVSKYSEALHALSVGLEKIGGRYKRLTGQSFSADVDVSTLRAAHLEYFDARLESVNVKHLPYPDIAHKALVDRALRRQKPFNNKGAGYRDALIWETILFLLRQDSDELFFVTKNKVDFGEGPQAHVDLLKDLDALGIEHQRLCVLSSLEVFNEQFIIPKTDRLDGIIEMLRKDTERRFSLRKWVGGNLLHLIHQDDVDDLFSPLEPDHGRAYVSSIDAVESVEVDDVRLLPSGELLLLATTRATLEVSVDVDWDDYIRYEDVREWFGDGEPFTYSSTEILVDATVSFSLVQEQTTYEVLSGAVDRIESDFGSVELNPHPKVPIQS